MSYRNHDGQIITDGHYVSDKISRVVEAIREYAPELEVQWIPPAAREPGDAAFRIMCFPSGGAEPYVVCMVKTEEEFDERVLKRIIAGDQRNGKILYSEYEAAERARQLLEKQKFLDAVEEAHEMAAAALRSNKDTYKVNDGLIIKENVGNIANKEK